MTEPLFKAEHNSLPQKTDWCVRFVPPARRNDDGTTTLSGSFPCLIVSDWVNDPEGMARQVAAVLEENRYRFSGALDEGKDETGPTVAMRTTGRGFALGEFDDANDAYCSIQESSAARNEGLIWLGVDDGRMHLTQSHVRALIPILQHFVAHGVLPEGNDG